MNVTEPKRYDPATDKIPVGVPCKLVYDEEKKRHMVVEKIQE